MKAISHVSHTADVQISVNADTLEELFEGALEGMNSILKVTFPSVNTAESDRFEVSISAPDSTCLLIDFLSEILTKSHERNKIFSGIKILELNPSFIKAWVYGQPIKSFDEDVKAVTYHMANVKKRPDGKWQTNIVFDI